MFALTSSSFRFLLSPRHVRGIALENLALRQQLGGNEETVPATEAAKGGSLVLGLAITNLAPLEKALLVCPTGDGRRLASARFPPFSGPGFPGESDPGVQE